MSWYEEEEERRRKFIRIPGSIAAIILIAILIVVPTLVWSTTVCVSVGHVAVVIDPIGKKMWTVGDGTHAVVSFFAKPPWARVVPVYVAVDKLEMWSEIVDGELRTGDYPAIDALTKDGLAVEVDVMLRWRIDPARVLELYRNYPMLNYKMTTIASIVREVVRDTIVEYTAIETIEKRPEIGLVIAERLREALARDRTLAGAILLEEFDLREIALPEKFKAAIEEKLAAEQMMIAAFFRAQAIITEAWGYANATIIRANATAEAIRLIAERCGLNATEIAQLYLLVETLKEIAKEQGKVILLVVIGEQGQYIIPIPPEGQE